MSVTKGSAATTCSSVGRKKAPAKLPTTYRSRVCVVTVSDGDSGSDDIGHHVTFGLGCFLVSFCVPAAFLISQTRLSNSDRACNTPDCSWSQTDGCPLLPAVQCQPSGAWVAVDMADCLLRARAPQSAVTFWVKSSQNLSAHDASSWGTTVTNTRTGPRPLTRFQHLSVMGHHVCPHAAGAHPFNHTLMGPGNTVTWAQDPGAQEESEFSCHRLYSDSRSKGPLVLLGTWGPRSRA